jgi:hypothetical protein
MPLVLNGIRFESLPETWTASKIYTNLTYEQCVELEGYYDKNYTKKVGGKRPKLPIERYQWQSYFGTPDHQPSDNIFCNLIACWKTAKLTFARIGLQPISKGRKKYERMLKYQNAMKASEAAAAAVNLLGASLSVSGSNPVGADLGGDGGSGDGADGPLADESTFETEGRSASILSCTSAGETEILARSLARSLARTHARTQTRTYKHGLLP